MTSSLQTSDDAAAKVATHPRVTLADIEANIAFEYSLRGSDHMPGFPSDNLAAWDALKLLTIHIIVTKSGFTFVGTSACASPENFNAELGRKFAREDAMRQMWLPMGYALKEKLRETAAGVADFLRNDP